MNNINHYESIAMLRLTGDERGLLEKRLCDLVDGFMAIEKIGTVSAEPLVSVLDIHNVLREDISDKLLTRDEIMANAPEQHDGYFQVPGTLG